MPRRLLRCLAVMMLADTVSEVRPAIAAWPPDGVPLCVVGSCNAELTLVCSDGLGGAFIVWDEFRAVNLDIYAQRVLASGEIAPGWPVNGLPVCTNPAQQGRTLWSVVADGLGGLLVNWWDHRNVGPGGTSSDIYAQRVLADGTIAPGWAVDGVAVTRQPGNQDWPVVIADGTGGAYYSWDTITNALPRDIYMQRLTANGAIAAGWALNGVAACTAPGSQITPRLAPDGDGGVFAAWEDFRDGQLATYAQRLLPDGTRAPGWPVDGMLVAAGQGLRDVVPDGAEGAYVACLTEGPTADANYYVQRITAAGTIATGWPAGGALVCAAPIERAGLRMKPDESGGAYLAWYDYRGTSAEIYAMRMRPDGTRAPGWPVNGLRVTDIQTGDYDPRLAADGIGGVYLTWERNTGGLDEVVVQHLTGGGGVFGAWPANGLVVPGNAGIDLPDITADGYGGAIVAWDRSDGTVRALRIGVDGPVAVTISLVSAEAEVGRVRLVWSAADAVSLAARVERRTEAVEWQALATVSPDGTGRIEYEDRDVVPGTRYAYRLAYSEDGSDRFTPETWVSVPRLELALRGFQPNPSVGIPTVAFVLGETAPAALEVFDVAGRRVANRVVGSLGPGRHVIALDTGTRLTPGVYAIRLMQGERVLHARGVVTR